MTKNRQNKDSLEIIFFILKIIPKHNTITASKIQQKLESYGYTRDIRSIQRILKMLCEHFTIHCDTRVRPYAYQWQDAATPFVLSKLTPTEAMLLHLSGKQLQNLLPTKLSESLKEYLVLAEKYLNQEYSHTQEKSWLDKILIINDNDDVLLTQQKTTNFETLTEALFEDLLVIIYSHHNSGIKAKQQVMPLGLIQKNSHLYLVFSQEYDPEPQIILVSQIDDVQLTTFRFNRPATFNLKDFIELAQPDLFIGSEQAKKAIAKA